MSSISIVRVSRADGAHAALAESLGVVIEKHFSEDVCRRWVAGVYEAKAEWTSDFGGEQFSLGRAFYTHFETDRSSDYFASAAESDRRVERALPGLQGAMRELVARVTGGRVVARRGWCGPGVHVFPPREPVARRGGVVHFDIEGLAAAHRARRRPALSVVAMLQPAQRDGGLRLWDVRYSGSETSTAAERERANDLVRLGEGDVIVFDSYRLHQIQAFDGDIERISATVHAAEVGSGQWETWF